ncbi:TPA: DUF262 domain-containing protein, partial [Shigella sonnei]|nr:DUF262 domain-containing protein [Shigella sonnei]
RVFEIVEYNQGEPGELFNRLNESLKLTSAEKRNAYVGDLRNQIKSLVDYMSDCGLDKHFLGFSNQRMAYHDLFIKLCYMLEKDSLIASYTEKQLNDRAREDEPFDNSIIELVKKSILILSKAKKKIDSEESKVHITKATLTSWLYFFSTILKSNYNLDDSLSDFFYRFESGRFVFREEGVLDGLFYCENKDEVKELLEEFNFRAVSRVMTGTSLLIRDFIISLFFLKSDPSKADVFNTMKKNNLKTAHRALYHENEKNLISVVNNYADSVLAGVTT